MPIPRLVLQWRREQRWHSICQAAQPNCQTPKLGHGRTCRQHLRLALCPGHRTGVGTAQDPRKRRHRILFLCSRPRPVEVSLHPQEVFENTVDIAHFATVHGVSAFGALDVEQEGHLSRAIAEVNFETPRGPVSGAVDSELFGMGVDVVRHRGLGRSCTILTVTPIDGEYVEARYTFFVAIDPDTGEIAR